MGDRMALLIATYDYQDSGLRRLTSPPHDAEAFAAVLRDPRIAGFDVTTLVNEPNHRVGEAIGEFYRDRRRDDLTLLYFTGHGLKDDEGRLYLAMANTRRDSLLFTALSAEQIDQAMAACASRQKVLILDCCYSGAFPAGRIAKADSQVHALERFQGRGRTVLTASDATQYSFEGNRLEGEAPQSVFTRYLVAGLRDGSADLDGDGNITLDELYSYVHDRVVEEMPQQRPKKQDNVEGRTVIARNVNWSLPVYLANAIGSPIAKDRVAALDGLAHLYRIGNDDVRARVSDEIRRLVDDDSRMVSAAAAALLERLHPTVKPPAPPAPAPPAQEPEPLPAPEPEPLPAPEPEPPLAQEPEPPPAPDPVPPPAPRSVRPRARAFRVPAKWRPPAHGWLAALAVALLMAGFGLEAATHHAVTGWQGVSLYVAALAAMVLGAAVCVLLPRTRHVVGPGLLLGSAAASVWGLVYLTGQAVRARTDVAYWLEVAGHVPILAAAGLVGAALWKDPAVRLELRRPRSARAWMAVALAGIAVLVGVLTMIGFLHTVTHLGRVYSGSTAGAAFADRARASLAIAVLTVAVPVWAAVFLPRPLRLSILGGWVGGALAVCAGSLWWTGTMTLRDNGGNIWYAGSLLALAGATALAARGAATSPVTVRRTALLAGLTAVPVLAAGTAVVVYQLAAAPITEVAPYGLAISPDGNRLYVVARVWTRNTDHPAKPETRPGRVWVIDAATHRRIGEPVPVGRGATDVAVSRDGGYVYVANQTDNTISVISALEKTTVGEPIRVGQRPGMVRITGTRLLVINGDSHDVAAVDTTTNRVAGARIPFGDSVGAAAITPDGGRVYVASGTSGEIQAIDTSTGKATGTRMVLGQQVEMMAVSPDGSRLYATSTVNNGTGLQARLTAFDTATGVVSGDAIPLGVGPQFGIAISPDGSRVYVTNFFDHSVSVIDTKIGAAVGRPVQVGGAPGAIAVSPNGDRVYVTLSGDGRVAAFRADAPGNLTLIDIKVS